MTRPTQRWQHALLGLFVLFAFSVPGRGLAWGDLSLVKTHRLRLAATLGAFRISHDRFPGNYASRWNFPVGGIVQVRVKGFPILLSVRHFSQKRSSPAAVPQSSPSSPPRWKQTMFNLGVGTANSRIGRFQSQVAFGLSIDRIREPEPFPVTGQRSSTATGFFIMTEVEYFLLPAFSVGWQFELSSAGAQKTAAFEANSVGGLYLGATLNVHAF